MKYCTKCGKEIMDDAVICTGCGCAQEVAPAKVDTDSSSVGFTLLGFFIPIVGLILYFVWKESQPLKAKSVGKGALIGFCVSIISSIFIAIIGATAGFMLY